MWFDDNIIHRTTLSSTKFAFLEYIKTSYAYDIHILSKYFVP